MLCASCGGRNEPDDAFCRWCGQPLAAEPTPDLAVRRVDGQPEPPHRPRTPRPHTRRPGIRRPRIHQPRTGRPGRRLLLAALAALVIAGVVAAIVLLVRPTEPTTAASPPVPPYGVVPQQAHPPTQKWSLSAPKLTSSCSSDPRDYIAGPNRQCELTIGQWPGGSLVATLAKGRPGQFRAAELFGVDPGTGGPSWRTTTDLFALCTPPDTRLLVCADATTSRVFRLDPATGQELWSTSFDGRVGAIDAVGEDVYLLAPGDAGTGVTRLSGKGRPVWTAVAPRSYSFLPEDGARVVLSDSVVHVGQLQDDRGQVWRARVGDGSPAQDVDSVLAVRDDVALRRGSDGSLRVGGTALGGAVARPGVDLPRPVTAEAAADGPLPSWIVNTPAQAGGTEYRYYAVDDATNYQWWDAAPPVAWCGGNWVTYDLTAGSLKFWTANGGSRQEATILGASGFVCDGTRVIVVDSAGLTAFDPQSEQPRWQTDVPDPTGVAASSHGILVTESNGMTVSLWR